MFGFWKKKTPPETHPANPGIGVEARFAFANGDRSWTEKVDLVQLAESALKSFSHAVKREKSWLEHPESGYLLSPQLVGLEPLEAGGVRTVTTIQVNHPALVPQGVFEYQHSTGDNAEESIRSGFDQWVQTDFVPLLDARSSRPEACTMLQMEMPVKEGRPVRIRRAILGPVAHLQQNPPPQVESESCQRVKNEAEGEHPFCPCCLLTRSFEAFKELLDRDAFYGLRLYAARFDGVPQADCRVNGEDWEPGAVALRKYAETWPEAGLEFRKQYVVLHTVG
jgi:uncharacterized protein DUF6348